MTSVWTHGTWTVLRGQEDAFVEAWTGLARGSIGRFGTAPPTLLRDRDRPNVFVTFGPFAGAEEVEAFRASDLFRDGVATMRPLLESFEAATLDQIAWR